MVLKIDLLTKLDLKPNWIYETIVTTYIAEDTMPNAAPMGIRFVDGQTAVISPYLSTQTYRNIEKHRSAVINFTYDLDIFFDSTFSNKKPKLTLTYFEKAMKVNAPQLKVALAHVEVSACEIQKTRERSIITGEIVHWSGTLNPALPLNRGYFLTLESIVHATRIVAFRDDPEKTKPLLDLVAQYRKIVEKVSPTGQYIQIFDKIQQIIEKKGLGD